LNEYKEGNKKKRKESIKQMEAKYNQAINEGNDAYNIEDLQKAKSAYESALNIKPDAQYPKEMLAEINAILEQEE